MPEELRPENSLRPSEGWHCGHFFYRWRRATLAGYAADRQAACLAEFHAALTPASGPARLQTFAVAGHKADFGFIALDADPLAVSGVHQRLQSGELGAVLEPVWSFVSITEVSEYLPGVDRFGQRLASEGLDPNGDEYRQRVDGYTRRLEIMRRQRLTPDLPNWPALCFYPMNKKRDTGENWFLLDFAERERLMGEHGESGMQFAGKVSQLVTVGIGLEDWEWGVTLWARNPQFLTQIVYRMRFDEASARYGVFGPFYAAYLMPPDEIAKFCQVG